MTVSRLGSRQSFAWIVCVLQHTVAGCRLTYGAGWTLQHTRRLGSQVCGAQHVAALGDFQPGGVNVENVVGNFWSVGAAIVIR